MILIRLLSLYGSIYERRSYDEEKKVVYKMEKKERITFFQDLYIYDIAQYSPTDLRELSLDE